MFSINSALAHFEETYPGKFRGKMKWLMFWFWYYRIPQVMAFRRIQMTKSVALGFGGEGAQIETQRDHDEAFPPQGTE